MLFLDVHLELVGVLELLGALPAADPLPVVLRVEVHLQRLLRLERLLALGTLVARRLVEEGLVHDGSIGRGGGGVVGLHRRPVLVGGVVDGGLHFFLADGRQNLILNMKMAI